MVHIKEFTDRIKPEDKRRAVCCHQKAKDRNRSQEEEKEKAREREKERERNREKRKGYQQR
jgi:hypothetical protein